MKISRALLAVCFVLSALTIAARATDLSGTWKWTSATKSGPAEITAVLLLKDGTLTGTVTGRQGPADISDASVKDGVVAFSVVRGTADQKVVIKYQGKFDGDTLTGTIERPGPNGAATTRTEWKATRAH
jgi:hypothetical protein